MTFLDFKVKTNALQQHNIARSTAHWRAKVSSYSRSRSESDPQMIEARRNMAISLVYEALRAGLVTLSLSVEEQALFRNLLDDAQDAPRIALAGGRDE